MICWGYYCAGAGSICGWAAVRAGSGHFLLRSARVKSHIRKWASPDCSAGGENETTLLSAQFHPSSMLLCSLRNSLHPEGSHTRVQRANPINKHERTGLARLLIKSNMWGGKLSSLSVCRYQRVCVIAAEKSGTASLVLLKWLNESIEGWHSGVFENRSDLDYFQAAWGRSVCGFTRRCVAGELSPLCSELTGAALCKWSGVWKELERMLVSFYQTWRRRATCGVHCSTNLPSICV